MTDRLPSRIGRQDGLFDFSQMRLRRIARSLTQFELQAPEEDEPPLSQQEILQELSGRPSEYLFLDFYTRQGIEDALRRYGLWAELEDRGLAPRLNTRRPDAFHHHLEITDGTGGPTVVELRFRFATLRPLRSLGEIEAGVRLDLLCIEWLMMQNPHSGFAADRPQLPGQAHPGLGLGRAVMTLLEIAGERLGRDGLLAFPNHYHNAFLYDRRYQFVDPAKEGELKALERDLAGLRLTDAAWAVEAGLVTDATTGDSFVWTAEEMIDPLSDPLLTYFKDARYTDEVARSLEKRRFRFEPDAVATLMDEVERRATRAADGY